MTELTWHRVADLDELPEGRVRTVVAGHRSVALTHYDGQYGALDNRCPHQGGPLGEGSIENGLLRCPWHGYDYCPLTGRPPSEFGDEVPTYAVEVRDDGIYVGVEPMTAARAHGLRRDGRDAWSPGASGTSSAWSGTPTSAWPTRSAAASRPASSSTSASATRARPRSLPRPTASSPAARLRA